jgi:hypothetical protein
VAEVAEVAEVAVALTDDVLKTLLVSWLLMTITSSLLKWPSSLTRFNIARAASSGTGKADALIRMSGGAPKQHNNQCKSWRGVASRAANLKGTCQILKILAEKYPKSGKIRTQNS